MNRGRGRTCRLLPPPGPLAWLYPELNAFGRPVAPGMVHRPDSLPGKRVEADGETWDLAALALAGSPLTDALAKEGFEALRIQPGPRGYTLWTWLRQSLRDRDGPSLAAVPPNPPRAGNGTGDPRIAAPLESLLARGAITTGRDETILLERGEEGGVETRRLPLAKAAAHRLGDRREEGEEAFAWLLPLHPGKALALHLDRVLEQVSESPGSYARARLLPFFHTRAFDAPEREGGPPATRLLPGYWGVLPGSQYGAAVRHRFRELLRLLFPERTFLFRVLENHALAGVDLYLESLMDRFEEKRGAFGRTSLAGGTRPLVLAVCGTDGSGKSSHVEALERHLKAKGLRVERHKIYRHGVFHDTVTDLTRGCGGERNLHLWRLQRLIKVFDSLKYFLPRMEEVFARCDVVLFDRYVFTHFAAGRGRFHHDPFARELLAPFPPADRVYLLDLPVEDALARIGKRPEKTVDENPYMLSRYRHVLLDLADRYGFLVLDGRAPFEVNRARILEDVDRVLCAREAGREG